MTAAEEAASVNTELEEKLEKVLVRYGVPADGLPFGGVADRGDLASDLAEAARSVLPRPDPDGYELVLGDLYVKLRMAYEDHGEHVMGPGSHAASRTCPNCGGTVTVDAEPEQRCGGEHPTDQCDALGGILWDLVEEAFPSEEADRWLAAPPAADFLDWASDAAGGGSLRDYMAEVMRRDAMQRIMPDYALVPVNPARTEAVHDG